MTIVNHRGEWHSGLDLCTLQKESFEIAQAHGFWDDETAEGLLIAIPEKYLVSTKLMLVVSELAEALEEVRGNQDLSVWNVDEKGKPLGFPTEIADAIIRLCDLAEYLGIDLSDVIASKQEFNESRPYKHGRSI